MCKQLKRFTSGLAAAACIVLSTLMRLQANQLNWLPSRRVDSLMRIPNQFNVNRFTACKWGLLVMSIHTIIDTFLSLVPKPAVTISSSAGTAGSSAYSGSVLTLTCTVTINNQVPQNDVMVNISWTKGSTDIFNTADNERITVTNAQQIGSSLNYTSTIVFNTLRQSDAGEYRCQANISNPSPYVADGIGSDNRTIITQGNNIKESKIPKLVI